MSTLREVSHIAKFNGQNFPLWKFGCWLLLEQHQLVKIVNGQERFPAEVRCTKFLSLYTLTDDNYLYRFTDYHRR